ncbi:hypothetical protein CVT24_001825 [Panaeolus cyanescens]|uniref:Uncharacterized protein n=1 Tax=Panaeolus cyanescens TaxID=181874 RepID=A0A409YFH8_9AGAR|nr:hypothetical protein CVT24_001825 [Panaeolus cyanescens]
MSTVVTVDDSDRNIVYSAGQWQRQRLTNANIFDGTLTFTSAEGAMATIQFQGSRIAVIGSVLADRTPPSSIYILDDENPQRFIATPSRSLQNGVVFYRSPTLPFGIHTLTIVNAERGTSPLILDAFTIDTAQNAPPANPNPNPAPGPGPNPTSPTPPDQSTSSPLPLSSPNPTPTPTTPSTSTSLSSPSSSLTSTTSPTGDLPPVIVTVTRASSSSSSPTPGSNGSLSGSDNTGVDGEKKSSVNTGAIAGGIVGAFLAIAVLVAAFMYWRRRRQQRREGGPQPLKRGHSSFWTKPSAPNPSSPPITPFVLDSELPSTSAQPYPTSSQSQSRRPPPPPPTQPEMTQYGSSYPFTSPSQQAFPQQGYNQQPGGYGTIPPPIIANNRFSTADSMYTDGPGARAAAGASGYGGNGANGGAYSAEGNEEDAYGGYTVPSDAPPLPSKTPVQGKGKEPVMAVINPFYPQAVNSSQTQFQSPSQYQNPSTSQYQNQSTSQYQNQQSPFYNPRDEAQGNPMISQPRRLQYIPPSQQLNARMDGYGESAYGGGYGAGSSSYAAGGSGYGGGYGASGSGYGASASGGYGTLDSAGRGMPVPRGGDERYYAEQSQGKKRERIRLD